MSELDGIDVLAECIEAVEDGRLTIEDCLTRYPEHRDSLQALLPLAVTLSHSSAVAPTADFRLSARQRLLKQLPAQPTQTPFWSHVGQTILSLYLVRKAASASWVSIVIWVAFLFTSGGLVYAADSAVPGSVLYGLDRSLEEVRLNWVLRPQTAVRLQLNNAQERLTEAEQLTVQGDSFHADMAMESYNLIMTAVEAMQNDDTQVINGTDGERPSTGFTSIITTTTPTMTPTITPTVTIIPTITSTATATGTPTVSATMTMTPTATILPTSTATPTVTITPSATGMPTETPAATVIPSDCTGDTPQPRATTLATQFGVSYEEIIGWFCSGFGFGEIEQAYDLSAETGASVSSIFALRASGMGWGQIRQQLQSSGTSENNNGQSNSNNGNNGQGNDNNGNNGQGNGNGGNNGQGNGNGGKKDK